MIYDEIAAPGIIKDIADGNYPALSTLDGLDHKMLFCYLALYLRTIGYKNVTHKCFCAVMDNNPQDNDPEQELWDSALKNETQIRKYTKQKFVPVSKTGYLKLNGEMYKLIIPDDAKIRPGLDTEQRCNYAIISSIKKSSKNTGTLSWPYFFKEGDWIEAPNYDTDTDENSTAGIPFFDSFKPAQLHPFYAISIKEAMEKSAEAKERVDKNMLDVFSPQQLAFLVKSVNANGFSTQTLNDCMETMFSLERIKTFSIFELIYTRRAANKTMGYARTLTHILEDAKKEYACGD